MSRTAVALSLWLPLFLGCSGTSDSVPVRDDGVATHSERDKETGDPAHTETLPNDGGEWEDNTQLEDDAEEATARVPLIRGLQEQLNSSPVFREDSDVLRDSLSEADRLLYRVKQENLKALRDAGRQIELAADRPNIVLFVVDDLGYGDLGCYGQQFIKTPHLDKLAADGVRFTHFYAGSPQGDASWWCLLTGRYTAHSGQADRAPYRISPQSVTLAEVMWQGGYDTVFFGNWSLAGAEQADMPHLHGFDEWTGSLCEETAVTYFPEYIFSNGVRARLKANADGNQKVYSNDFFMQELLAYLARRDTRKPFFVVVSYAFPRRGANLPLLDAYRDLGWSDEQMAYASTIGRLDSHVGMILDQLKEQELDGQTALFLTSDGVSPQNPAELAERFANNGELRGFKGSLYEGGIRVPCLARWPGHFPKATLTDYPAAVWDLLPTFVELGAVTRRPSKLDGVSLTPVLRGKNGKTRPRLYWEAHQNGWSQAVRTGAWKAVRPAGKMTQDDIELYNLDEDPGETTNVAKERPEIVTQVIDATSP